MSATNARKGISRLKLIRMCEELNECFGQNYLACALLIRAAMNHIPPVFGFRTFKEVVANRGRSVKSALELLDDDARIRRPA